MLTEFMRGLSAILASSEFEKCRLRATSHRDTYPPSEGDIVMMLSCLADNDPETRPSTAFTTIVAKLQSSKSRFNWNYVLKNLVILDRCLEEGLFLFDIAELNVEFVEHFSDKNSNNNNIGLDSLIRKYYFYLKAKARLYSRLNSVRIESSAKKEYFRNLSLNDILLEIRLLIKIISFIFEIAETGTKGYLKYDLCQYVYLLMLDTSMKCFASVYLGIIHMLDRVFGSSLAVARECFNVYQEYLNMAEMLIVFNRNHQSIKGFEGASIKDFSNPKLDSEVLSSISAYIHLLEERRSTHDIAADFYEYEEIERRLSELMDKKLSLHVDSRPQRPKSIVGDAEQSEFKGGIYNPRDVPIGLTESVMVSKPKKVTSTYLETKQGGVSKNSNGETTFPAALDLI